MVKEPEKTRILAVDDNADALYALEKMLSHAGYEVSTAKSGLEAIEGAKNLLPSAILLDVMMPEMDGLEVTRIIKNDPVLRFVPVILVTAKDSLADVIAGLDNGADGYISKPFKPEELLARTRAALRIRKVYEELRSTEEKRSKLLRELSNRYSFDNIIGKSAAMQQVFSLLEKVARSDSPVLIAGASGTGKELIARALHYNSPRKDMAFVAKNCAAFSDQLLESQLFGHLKGAFTGAVRDQKGLFEAADKGTLFLDEIGEMPLALQAKLLRVLQEGCFMPVGTTDERKVDVRVIAASNRNLRAMCDEGTFREDLFFRLNVICIELPPLSSRREDIPLLIDRFLERAAQRRDSARAAISPEAMDMLVSYEWRGNVRELENEIERMLILGDDGKVLGPELVSVHIREAFTKLGAQGGLKVQTGGTLREAIENLERKLIGDTLEQLAWNKTGAAKALGISRSNLIAKVQQYGLEK